MLNQPASTAYWVEAGQAYGSPQGARRYFYWADQRPGHGYSEHDDTSSDTPSLGTGYFDYIDQYTATSYSVASGPWSGTSTGWASGYTFGELQTGTETSNDGEEVAERGQSYGLGYYNTPSNYGHTNWTYGSNTPGKFPSPTDWGSISTVSTYSDYEINATSTCTLGNAASSQNAVTAAQLKSASVSLFKRDAAADSGHRSYLATWANSTAAVAERSLYGSFSSAHSSPVTDAAAPVMVLVATGARFTAHDAKIPAGAAAPTGSVLTEIIDLTTGRIRDWGVTTHNPGLSRLGFVHNLA